MAFYNQQPRDPSAIDPRRSSSDDVLIPAPRHHSHHGARRCWHLLLLLRNLPGLQTRASVPPCPQ